MVCGNPLNGGIKQRGGADPDDVVNAMHEEFMASFGPEPATMPRQALAFTCRAP